MRTSNSEREGKASPVCGVGSSDCHSGTFGRRVLQLVNTFNPRHHPHLTPTRPAHVDRHALTLPEGF